MVDNSDGIQIIHEHVISVHYPQSGRAQYELRSGEGTVLKTENHGECVRLASAMSAIRKAVFKSDDPETAADILSRSLDEQYQVKVRNTGGFAADLEKVEESSPGLHE